MSFSHGVIASQAIHTDTVGVGPQQLACVDQLHRDLSCVCRCEPWLICALLRPCQRGARAKMQASKACMTAVPFKTTGFCLMENPAARFVGVQGAFDAGCTVPLAVLAWRLNLERVRWRPSICDDSNGGWTYLPSYCPCRQSCRRQQCTSSTIVTTAVIHVVDSLFVVSKRAGRRHAVLHCVHSHRDL